MAIIRTKDYRSDIVLTLHMTLGGETVNVPQHDFLLRFFTEHEARHYDCGRIKGEWLHCAPDESDATLLTCYIKNHGLGCGMLQCLYVDLSPNDGMEDGVQRTFSVSGIDLELVDDASDDTQAVDGTVVVDINAVLTELKGLQVDLTDAIAAAEAATASANSAASAAASSAMSANTAAVRAETAANNANTAADDATSAANAANDSAASALQSQQKNIKSVVYIGATGDGVANTVRITLNDGTEVTGSVFNGHTGAKGEDGVSVVFGSLNNGIFYDRDGREAVRSADLLYVSISDGKMYRWGTNSYVYLGMTVDPQPTADSSNLVSSGGVYDALEEISVGASVSLANVPFLENPNQSSLDVFNIYKTYDDYLAWVRDHRSSHFMPVAELLEYLDANVGQYVLLLDSASSPEYVQRLSVVGGKPGATSATTYIELRSHDNGTGLKISFIIDRTATNTGTTLTAERSSGLSTASYNGNTKVNEVSIAPTGIISKTASNVTKTYDLPSESGTLALASEVAVKANANDVAAALEKKANLTSLYRFAGFSIIADGSPEDAAMAFGPYVDVLSSKLDTYCPGWGDVADHRSILQLIRLNNAGSYNSEYLFTGAFGDGLRRAASEAHEMGFNSLVFPADLVVYEAGVDMLEERIDAVERDKADKSEIVEEIPFVFGEFEHGSGAVYGRYCGSCSLSSIEEGQLIALHLEHNTVAGTNSLRLTLSNGSTHEAEIWEYKYDINSRLVPEPVNGSGEYPEGSVLILAFSNGMWMITNPAKRPRLMTTNDWGVPIGRIVSGTFLRDNFYVKSEVDSALSAYATGAEYDSASKRIYLKHGSDRLTGAYVDATAFIKDGMVDNVTINSGYLVITFNTDSGKEPISLAITDIFNASNYYTKAEIDQAGYLTQESDPTVPSHVKSITQSNIASWSGKQDAIGDLADIRSGASKGATAYQKPSGGIPKSDLASAVQTSLGKADTALQSFTESDPTVPAWAKASSKPTYTAAEVGALPASTAIPSKTSDLTNDSNFVVDADYVHTDSNYTAAEKSKLSGISAGAEVNVQSDWSVTETTSDAFIKNKPTIPTESTVIGWGFTKNTGTITGIKMNGASKGTSGVVDLGTVLTSESDPTVPSWAKQSTKPTYNGGEVKYTGTTGNVVTNNTTLNVAVQALDDVMGDILTALNTINGGG